MSAVQVMVGGYHLIMSVISFVAFHMSSTRGCKLRKVVLQSVVDVHSLLACAG